MSWMPGQDAEREAEAGCQVPLEGNPELTTRVACVWGEKKNNSNRGGSPGGVLWPSARRQSIRALQGSSWLTYHIPGAGPGAFHRRLIDGLGFEARGGWADSSGRDMLKCQRTVPQVSLGPGRNLVGCMSCQVAHWGNRDKGLGAAVRNTYLYMHTLFFLMSSLHLSEPHML